MCRGDREGCDWPTVVTVRSVPWWGMLSAAVAPVLLIGGWTVAAGLQPGSFNPVADTISALAARNAADRWVMTLALGAVGACYVVTGLALRPAAWPGRLVLMAGGVATILVAANPEPAGSGSVPHFFWAAVEFVALAVWPAFSRSRGSLVPYGLRPAVRGVATAVMAGLLGWFGAELVSGGAQLGLSERVLAGVQVLWPLAVVWSCSRSRSRASPPVGRPVGPPPAGPAGPAGAGRQG